MTTQRTSARNPAAPSDTLFLGGIFGLVALVCVLWSGGVVASLISGHGYPHSDLAVVPRLIGRASRPALAWGHPMPGPVTYWFVTAATALICGALGGFVVRRIRGRANPGESGYPPGIAGRAEIRASASSKAVLRRASIVRPALRNAAPADIGYRLGNSHGVDVWMSVEDSLVVLGPPRSGKGRHFVIPMLLNAPGAVITTSTRPDNVVATVRQRSRTGPIAVFDPQQLAPDLIGATRWSPIRGCDDPQTAMIRARALAAGGSDRVENRGFWQAQTESALRAFLHAAALDGRSPADLYRWSLEPAAAGEAVRILNAAPSAAPGWPDALDAVISGDPRTRDNSWAGIRIALSALADPRVLAAVSPKPDEKFDPAAFLRGNGTLYLLGTASGVGAAANLVAAFVEDLIEVGRRLAAQSVGTRLDPPVALILDEAANYALPSLPALISEGGGTGITTVAVLQSLAQARARWGEHEGAAIWDAASVKAILGGGSNARDLHDLSALIGERDEHIESWSRDSQGRRSTSGNLRRVPILDTGRLRTLPFGTAVLLLRAARPILLDCRAAARKCGRDECTGTTK